MPSAERPPVFRFAPSPNGRLHLGHALSALANQRLARAHGGRLLLRIEDIDRARCRPEFEAAIRADLDWLGIAFDGEVRRQSEHMADYAAAAENLRARGLIYPCFCSRAEVRAAAPRRGGAVLCDPDGAPLYGGACRGMPAAEAEARLAAGELPAWRLDLAEAVRSLGSGARGLGWTVFDEAGREAGYETWVAARPERWGDVVLVRKDTPTSYHLSVVVDDAIQGVSHVVRGWDLEAATDIHVLLQALLGLPAPRYHFHPLLLDPDDRKLAKSRGSESLADLRAKGETPAAIRARLGFG